MVNEKQTQQAIQDQQNRAAASTLPEKLDPPPAAPDTAVDRQEAASSEKMSPENRNAMIGAIIGVIVLFISTIISIVWLAQPGTDTAKVRDIFIIFMALSSLLTTFVLIILIIQLARLLNLLQNELGPILDSLNIMISNLRGTTVFISENLSEPVIKMNEYLAGLSQLLSALGFMRKIKKSKNSKGE